MKQTFRSHSPVQRVHPFSSGSSPSSFPAPPPPKTILVVADDPGNIEVLREILRELGFHLISASDGRQALKILDTVSVDGILLDLDMASMDGQTLLDEIRWRGHHLPVLVMTAGYDQPFLHNLVNEGAQGYLIKPIAVEQITRHCQRLFGTLLPSPVSDFRECIGMLSTAL